MPASGRFDHLRHSALELLSSGNSTVAVARLLDVPVSVVARWRDEPAPARPEPAVLMAARRAQGRPIGFRTTLVVAPSLSSRLWNYAAAAYVAGNLAVCVADTVREQGSWRGHVAVMFVSAIAIAAVVWWLCRYLQSLVLGIDGFIVPRLFGRSFMAYSDLADYWLVLHVLNEGRDDECVGRLLTLHSRRAGVRPLEVFIRDRDALDPRVVERLELVKKANQGEQPLTPLGSIASRP
jgi:hypothetical protein